jgi:prephenate dehydratase
MADRVKKVGYTYLTVSNRAGQGEKILGELRNEGINLLAYSGFPTKGGKAQLDFIPENMTAFRRVARKNGWRTSKPKKGFLVTGGDQVGAVYKHINKLADANINVTAADAVAAGKGRYGMILWVKPKYYNRAARVLRAK